MPEDTPTNDALPLSRVIHIALGSNLGEPLRQLREAAAHLQALTSHPIRLSTPWLTTPRDCPEGSPEFANAVAELVLPEGWTPETLLTRCQDIERQCGRQPKKVVNAARLLDLDLIAFGQETRRTARLVLPHPRAHQRFFVLAPLAELAPNLLLPGHQHTVREQLNQCEPDPAARRLSPFDWFTLPVEQKSPVD